ncbi:hypothetical protein PAENIP36_31580 [Paenibacillus sp. P36]
MADSEITVESTVKSLVAARNLLELAVLAVEIPVISNKIGFRSTITGGIGANYK